MSVSEPSSDLERALLASGASVVVGVDEVGRGALAGPVAVGAVAITAASGPSPAGIRDSKLLTPRRRRALIDPILQWCAASAVGYADASEVDAQGIVVALGLASRRAVERLGTLSGTEENRVLLLDGSIDYLSPWIPGWRVVTRVKADRDCMVVAAASVVAKVERDSLMERLDKAYPGYGFAAHKGYGTAAHRAAIDELGPCRLHRLSWLHPTLGGLPPRG